MVSEKTQEDAYQEERKLIRYLRVMEKLTSRIQDEKNSKESILSSGVKQLLDVGFDKASLYLYDENFQECRLVEKQDKSGTSDKSDTKIDFQSEEFLPLAKGIKNYIIKDKGMAIDLPLKGRDKINGLLRVENTLSKNVMTSEDIQLLLNFSRILGVGLETIYLSVAIKQQKEELSVYNKINSSMMVNIPFEEILEIILTSMMKIFMFDRIRLFVIDEKDKKLKGKVSAEMNGEVHSIDDMEYSMEEGVHQLVDVVMGKQVDSLRLPLVYYPLVIRGKTVGVLSAENIFSLQPIIETDKDRIEIFARQIISAYECARTYQAKDLPIIDKLTNLYLHRYFHQRLTEEFARSIRYNQPLSLAIVCIDHYKQHINSYGHQVGDELLAKIANLILDNTREVDFVARYGGDDIAIIFANTPLEGVKIATSRIIEVVKKHRFIIPGGVINLTLSLGVATLTKEIKDKSDLIKITLNALYRAKTEGGNQIIYAE